MVFLTAWCGGSASACGSVVSVHEEVSSSASYGVRFVFSFGFLSGKCCIKTRDFNVSSDP